MVLRNSATLRPAFAPMLKAQRGSCAMRSLWRRLALRWLGGEGSDALGGEAALLDTLLGGQGEGVAEIYRVTREAGVSHRALLPQSAGAPDPARAIPDRVLPKQ
jgi:hypothetical protein